MLVGGLVVCVPVVEDVSPVDAVEVLVVAPALTRPLASKLQAAAASRRTAG
jgi:hypothetical protein